MSNNGSPAAAAAAAATSAADWRTSVEQSYRNTEVREIAKVLAALEPGASAASKLRLAMQFEDVVYKGATSLADYRKKLTKRLKKLQKNYVPTEQGLASQKERALHELRQKYGDSIRYIVEHADAALKETEAKKGQDEAKRLRVHTEWAKEMGQRIGVINGSGDDTGTKKKDAADLTGDEIKKLAIVVDALRLRVVKLCDPDRFLLECLERSTTTDAGRGGGDKAQQQAKMARQVLAADLKRQYEHVQQKRRAYYQHEGGGGGGAAAASAGTPNDASSGSVNPEAMLRQSMVTATKPTPAPTRSRHANSGGSQQQEPSQAYEEATALLHLDKMRAASTAVLAYLMHVPDNDNKTKAGGTDKTDTSTSAANVVVKSHTIVQNGIQYVEDVMQKRRAASKEPDLTLEDAWMRIIEMPSWKCPRSDSQQPDESSAAAPLAKRAKTTPKAKIVSRSRVLFTAGRKTPYRIVPSLKRKRAHLIRPEPSGYGSHVVLHFDKTFTMTIYFVPLLVTIRAYQGEPGDENGNAAGESADGVTAGSSSKPPQQSIASSSADTKIESTSTRSPVKLRCATWTPLHSGLTPAAVTPSDHDKTPPLLTVWGAKASYESIGHVVEERLRDASARATYVLRSIFGHSLAKDNLGDFETEILEGTALLEFLHLARTTYIPNWTDDDIA